MSFGRTPIHYKPSKYADVSCNVPNSTVGDYRSFLEPKSSLHEIILSGKKKEIKKVLEKGTPVDYPNQNGETALYIASFHGRDDMVIYLLKYGAKPNIRSRGGSTPVHAAAMSGSLSSMQELVRAGGDLRLHDDQGRTVQDWAYRNADYKQTLKMLEFIDKVRLCARTLSEGSACKISLPDVQHGTLPFMKMIFGRTSGLKAKAAQLFNSGTGEMYVNRESTHTGLVASVPFIQEQNLLHDDFGISYHNGAYMVMESMYWNEDVPVTVRRMKGDRPADGYVDLLITECEYMRKVQHSSILLLMAVCNRRSEDDIVLLYERVGCGSLYVYLYQKMEFIELWPMCDLIRQVCEAITYLHHHKYIHCSITSHAVHLVSPTTAKLSNFEYMVQKTVDGIQPRSKVVHNQYMNSVYNWLAPELMAGEPPTTAADVYGLSSLVWEVVHGMLPWRGLTAKEIYDKVYKNGIRLQVGEDQMEAPFDEVLGVGLMLRPSMRSMSVSRLHDIMAQVVVDRDYLKLTKMQITPVSPFSEQASVISSIRSSHDSSLLRSIYHPSPHRRVSPVVKNTWTPPDETPLRRPKRTQSNYCNRHFSQTTLPGVGSSDTTPRACLTGGTQQPVPMKRSKRKNSRHQPFHKPDVSSESQINEMDSGDAKDESLTESVNNMAPPKPRRSHSEDLEVNEERLQEEDGNPFNRGLTPDEMDRIRILATTCKPQTTLNFPCATSEVENTKTVYRSLMNELATVSKCRKVSPWIDRHVRFTASRGKVESEPSQNQEYTMKENCEENEDNESIKPLPHPFPSLAEDVPSPIVAEADISSKCQCNSPLKRSQSENDTSLSFKPASHRKGLYGPASTTGAYNSSPSGSPSKEELPLTGICPVHGKKASSPKKIQGPMPWPTPCKIPLSSTPVNDKDDRCNDGTFNGKERHLNSLNEPPTSNTPTVDKNKSLVLMNYQIKENMTTPDKLIQTPVHISPSEAKQLNVSRLKAGFNTFSGYNCVQDKFECTDLDGSRQNAALQESYLETLQHTEKSSQTSTIQQQKSSQTLTKAMVDVPQAASMNIKNEAEDLRRFGRRRCCTLPSNFDAQSEANDSPQAYCKQRAMTQSDVNSESRSSEMIHCSPKHEASTPVAPISSVRQMVGAFQTHEKQHKLKQNILIAKTLMKKALEEQEVKKYHGGSSLPSPNRKYTASAPEIFHPDMNDVRQDTVHSKSDAKGNFGVATLANDAVKRRNERRKHIPKAYQNRDEVCKSPQNIEKSLSNISSNVVESSSKTRSQESKLNEGKFSGNTTEHIKPESQQTDIKKKLKAARAEFLQDGLHVSRSSDNQETKKSSFQENLTPSKMPSYSKVYGPKNNWKPPSSNDLTNTAERAPEKLQKIQVATSSPEVVFRSSAFLKVNDSPNDSSDEKSTDSIKLDSMVQSNLGYLKRTQQRNNQPHVLDVAMLETALQHVQNKDQENESFKKTRGGVISSQNSEDIDYYADRSTESYVKLLGSIPSASLTTSLNEMHSTVFDGIVEKGASGSCTEYRSALNSLRMTKSDSNVLVASRDSGVDAEKFSSFRSSHPTSSAELSDNGSSQTKQSLFPKEFIVDSWQTMDRTSSGAYDDCYGKNLPFSFVENVDLCETRTPCNTPVTSNIPNGQVSSPCTLEHEQFIDICSKSAKLLTEYQTEVNESVEDAVASKENQGESSIASLITNSSYISATSKLESASTSANVTPRGESTTPQDVDFTCAAGPKTCELDSPSIVGELHEQDDMIEGGRVTSKKHDEAMKICSHEPSVDQQTHQYGDSHKHVDSSKQLSASVQENNEVFKQVEKNSSSNQSAMKSTLPFINDVHEMVMQAGLNPTIINQLPDFFDKRYMSNLTEMKKIAKEDCLSKMKCRSVDNIHFYDVEEGKKCKYKFEVVDPEVPKKHVQLSARSKPDYIRKVRDANGEFYLEEYYFDDEIKEDVQLQNHLSLEGNVDASGATHTRYAEEEGKTSNEELFVSHIIDLKDSAEIQCNIESDNDQLLDVTCEVGNTSVTLGALTVGDTPNVKLHTFTHECTDLSTGKTTTTYKRKLKAQKVKCYMVALEDLSTPV